MRLGFHRSISPSGGHTWPAEPPRGPSPDGAPIVILEDRDPASMRSAPSSYMCRYPLHDNGWMMDTYWPPRHHPLSSSELIWSICVPRSDEDLVMTDGAFGPSDNRHCPNVAKLSWTIHCLAISSTQIKPMRQWWLLHIAGTRRTLADHICVCVYAEAVCWITSIYFCFFIVNIDWFILGEFNMQLKSGGGD